MEERETVAVFWRWSSLGPGFLAVILYDVYQSILIPTFLQVATLGEVV